MNNRNTNCVMLLETNECLGLNVGTCKNCNFFKSKEKYEIVRTKVMDKINVSIEKKGE